MAELARDNPLQVRFIEIMPLGEGKRFPLRSEDELTELLVSRFGPVLSAGPVAGNGPAKYVTFEGFRGNIGFISAISHKFCSSCNRLRLTADGYIKTCLQFDTGCFLRPLLRDGSEDGLIRDTIVRAVYEKPRCHEFAPGGGNGDVRLMSQIGG